MKSTATTFVMAVGLIALGIAMFARGIYVAQTYDMPGGAVMGILLMIGAVVLGVKTARNRLPTWAVRSALAAGVLVAMFAGLLAYQAATARSLHPDPQGAPSVSQSAPSPRWSSAVDRARQIVRTDLSEQNLPGLSVAVGANGDILWAEGFGWADLKLRHPVTPDTRFRIGTASTILTSAAVGVLMEQGRLQPDEKMQQLMARVADDVEDDDPLFRRRCERPVDALKYVADESTHGWVRVSAAVETAADQPFLTFMQETIFQPLEMDGTGAESASEENPEHIGEPEEDFPGFTLIHRVILEPIGISRPPAAGTIATSYSPRSAADPRRGVVAMRPRNLSCYAGALAFYSTPSDLVRFALDMNDGKLLQAATVKILPALQQLAGGHDGELAGGRVMSLVTVPPRGIVVAVTSNISHADTSAIARRVAEAFADADAGQ